MYTCTAIRCSSLSYTYSIFCKTMLSRNVCVFPCGGGGGSVFHCLLCLCGLYAYFCLYVLYVFHNNTKNCQIIRTHTNTHKHKHTHKITGPASDLKLPIQFPLQDLSPCVHIHGTEDLGWELLQALHIGELALHPVSLDQSVAIVLLVHLL